MTLPVLKGKAKSEFKRNLYLKKKIPLRIHQTFRQNHKKDIKCFNICHKHFSMSHFHVTILKHIAQKQIMDLFFNNWTFFYLFCSSSVYVLDSNTFWFCIHCKYLFPICGLSFDFVMSGLSKLDL